MDSKKKTDLKMAEILQVLHQQIDSIKEKVEKLCESTQCFESLLPTASDDESSKT